MAKLTDEQNEDITALIKIYQQLSLDLITPEEFLTKITQIIKTSLIKD